MCVNPNKNKSHDFKSIALKGLFFNIASAYGKLKKHLMACKVSYYHLVLIFMLLHYENLVLRKFSDQLFNILEWLLCLSVISFLKVSRIYRLVILRDKIFLLMVLSDQFSLNLCKFQSFCCFSNKINRVVYVFIIIPFLHGL